MFTRLPPVGFRIVGDRRPQPDWPAHFPGYSAQLLDSGTSALAMALKIAAANKQTRGRPEVIMPAYGCPDLISAAEFSGVEPVLIDIEPSSPKLALSQLDTACNENTVAIVAINFLGLPDRLIELKSLASTHDIILIEDNAQWFPDSSATVTGDCVILSFGRGKPVSLLSGGMLLIKDSLNASPLIHEALSTLASLATSKPGFSDPLRYRMKRTAYNRLITPAVYGVVDRLPFTQLGETIFKPLYKIKPMPPHIGELLASNIDQYFSRSTKIQQRQIDVLLNASMAKSRPDKKIISLGSYEELHQARMLRLPFLVDARQRDNLLKKLKQAGLGATCLYKQALGEIQCVQGKVKVMGQNHAQDFSKRLITVSLSGFLSEKHVKIFTDTISNWQKN